MNFTAAISDDRERTPQLWRSRVRITRVGGRANDSRALRIELVREPPREAEISELDRELRALLQDSRVRPNVRGGSTTSDISA